MMLGPSTEPRSIAVKTYHSQLIRELDLYYERTKVLLVLRQFVYELAQRFHVERLVPLNPFASLLSHLRRAEIDVNELLNREPQKPPPQELLVHAPGEGRGGLAQERQTATIKTVPPPRLVLWGERCVMERVPYSERWQRRMEIIVELIGASWLAETEIQDEGCRVRCVGVLVGSGVLLGHDQVDGRVERVEIERHIVVAGDQLEFGMTVFARQLIRTLFEVKKEPVMTSISKDRLILKGATSVEITTKSEKATWTSEHMGANRQAFFSAVKTALAAGGWISMDILYEVAGESRCLLRLYVEFFFHLDADSSPATSTATKPTPHTFASQSRRRESGVCLSSVTSFELTQRELRHSVDTPSTVQTTRLNPVNDLVQRMLATASSPQVARYWLTLLPSTQSFRLVSLVSSINDLLFTIRTLPNEDISRLLRPLLTSYKQDIAQLAQDATIGRSSSLLLGLSDAVRRLCSLPQEISALETEASLRALYDRLQTARDTLTWLNGAMTRDFLHLMDPSTLPTLPMADLRADIILAIEQRRFPPAIVVESIFAQYLVETKLDVTLERALVNTVASGLPPNPFILITGFSLSSAVAFLQLQSTPTIPNTPVTTAVGFALEPVATPGSSTKFISANRRLVAAVNGHRVAQQLNCLKSSRVLHSDTYQPPKASYSARISASLLLGDPLLFSQLSGILMESAETIEHIMIEGQDAAMALVFYAEAVRRDVSRLLTVFYELTLELLGPDGAVLTPVELHEIQMFEQLIVEATPKLCVLRVSLPPLRSSGNDPLVRVVRKLYMFHYIPTENTSDTGRVAGFLSSRLRQMAVFTDVEVARIVLNAVSHEANSVPMHQHTDERRDQLMTGHTERLTQDNQSLRQPPDVLWHLYDMETALEWVMRQKASSMLTREVLEYVSSAIRLHVAPLVDALGIVDAQKLRETVDGIGSTAPHGASASEASAVEHRARRIFTLVVLVRFMIQEMGSPAPQI